MDDLLDQQSRNLESEYVKSTYEKIADDFSSTRYKKWPKVDAYLHSLSQSALLLDIGCGNGKYLDNSKTYNIGCDLSLKLLRICKSKGFEVVLCDMTRLPFRSEVFDSVICVAALHHITTTKRRKKCLTDIVGLMNPQSSKCLVQVWSFEQQREPGNPYLSSRTHKSDEICMRSSRQKVTFNDSIELTIHKNRTPFTEQDVLVPFQGRSEASGQPSNQGKAQYLRYYHVFREKELDQMFQEIPSVKIVESYYDKGNWCIVAAKGNEIGTNSCLHEGIEERMLATASKS